MQMYSHISFTGSGTAIVHPYLIGNLEPVYGVFIFVVFILTYEHTHLPIESLLDIVS